MHLVCSDVFLVFTFAFLRSFGQNGGAKMADFNSAAHHFELSRSRDCSDPFSSRCCDNNQMILKDCRSDRRSSGWVFMG